MRVLHVSHSLDTGGGPLYIKKIIQDIPQVNHYVAGNKGYYFSLFTESLGGNHVYLLQRKNILSNMLILKKICKKNSIHVIHCHGRGAALYSRLLKLFGFNVQIIYTVHGFHPDTLNPFIKLFYILLEKLLFQLTNVVINVSESERQRFISVIKPKNLNKIVYIPNYISSKDIKISAPIVELDHMYVNILYIGRLSHEKGIDILIDAWTKIKDDTARLYVVGYGPLEYLLKSNSKKIFYLGKIENASSLIVHFDSIIIPSRFEGMPFTGLESMISKASVIATPAVGITDLFNPETSYMAKDFSSEALSVAITLFLHDFKKDQQNIKIKQEVNYKKVLNEFSKKNAERLYKVYQSI